MRELKELVGDREAEYTEVNRSDDIVWLMMMADDMHHLSIPSLNNNIIQI